MRRERTSVLALLQRDVLEMFVMLNNLKAMPIDDDFPRDFIIGEIDRCAGALNTNSHAGALHLPQIVKNAFLLTVSLRVVKAMIEAEEVGALESELDEAVEQCRKIGEMVGQKL